VQGPSGVFVPPPPGSRPGLIVPAPVGTNPAVVVGAPPLLRPGMEVRPGDGGHVQIVAPANVTASGRPVNTMAPVQAHLAAAQTPVVRVAAPTPVSRNAIPTFNPRSGFSKLPEARPVQPVVSQPNALRASPSAGGPSMESPPGAGSRAFAQPQGEPRFNAQARPAQPSAPAPQAGGPPSEPQFKTARRPPQRGSVAQQAAASGHATGARPEGGRPGAKPAPKKEHEREHAEKERRG